MRARPLIYSSIEGKYTPSFALALALAALAETPAQHTNMVAGFLR
jgi:hypothetical protein